MTVCRCSKGFRSVTGHGHFHCRHCRETFRYRVLLFGHEERAHGKTKPNDVDTVLQDTTSSESVVKPTSRLRSASTSENKNVDELSARSQNDDKCHQNTQARDASPDRCVSRKQKRQTDQSNSCSGNSDSEKYATRVTIWAGGRKVTSQVPCYSGNMVFPAPAKRRRKARCPICGQMFVRNDTFRNHVICVHNIMRAGDTIYSCMPCRYETSYNYIFNNHLESLMHRSNLKGSSSSSFYASAHSQPFQLVVGAFAKPEPRVVWYSQKNHLCSSQCLSGLNTQPPPAADETDEASQSAGPQKSLDAPAANVQTAAPADNNDKEARTLRSSATRVKKKVTMRKSTTQPLVVAFSFTEKKKDTAGANMVSKTTETSTTESRSKKKGAARANKASKANETSVPESRDNKAKASFPEEVLTISDSDSEEDAAAKKTSTKTQLSAFNKKQTSSDVTEVPSLMLPDKQKDSLSSESANTGGCLKVPTSKSTGAAGSHRVEASSVSCSGPSGSTGVVSISEQNSCKPAASTAAKMPVTTVQQVHASSMSVSTPVSADVAVSSVSVVSSSAALRSVPVIGVAKAVPAVTTVTHTTTMSSRSMYSLHRFSAETLWSELCRRGSMRSCDCGISFMDSALYLLHRSCHSDLGALKCAFCDHKADTTYDFHAHLLDHKK